MQIFANTHELEPFQTIRGVPYHPLWRAMPILEPFYSSYEKRFNAAPAVIFMFNNMWLLWAFLAAYLAFCFAGPRLMKNRKPLKLKRALCVWNLCLSLVSFVGFIRIGGHLLYLLSPHGGFTFRDTVCRSPEHSYGDNATGLWCVVFTACKLLAVMDSVFVVLRKKPLRFLHWYHHSTLLVLSWQAHVALTPALYFMSLSFLVDGAMYLYLLLQDLKLLPRPSLHAYQVTMAQVSQMFAGIFVTAMMVYYRYLQDRSAGACEVDDRTLGLLTLMFTSYLALFLDIALRYVLLRRAASLKSLKIAERSPKPSNGQVALMHGATIEQTSDEQTEGRMEQTGSGSPRALKTPVSPSATSNGRSSPNKQCQ